MRRLLTIPLCLLLLATVGAGVSAAFFAKVRSSTGNAASAATIDLTGVNEGGAVIDDPLLQGTSVTKTVQLNNKGTVPARLVVTPKNATGDLRHLLTVKLESCGTSATCASPSTIASGYMGDTSNPTPGRVLLAYDAAVDVGSTELAVDESRFVRITVEWPTAGGAAPSATAAAALDLRWTLRTRQP